MSGFINFSLIKNIKQAVISKVIKQYCLDTEEEERHLSELERRMIALDEVEVYVVTRTFINHHRDIFARTLEYIEKEQKKEGETTE